MKKNKNRKVEKKSNFEKKKRKNEKDTKKKTKRRKALWITVVIHSALCVGEQ